MALKKYWIGLGNGKSFAVLSDFIEVNQGYDLAVQSVLGHAFERLCLMGDSKDADAAFAALQFFETGSLGSASIQVGISSQVGQNLRFTTHLKNTSSF